MRSHWISQKAHVSGAVEVNVTFYLVETFRAGLHLDAGAYASYGLNPTPQSPIGSECVDVKGEISHPTLNMLLKLGDCYSPT